MAAHLEPAYANLVRDVQLPVTERLSASTLIIPLFHQLTAAEQNRVVDVISAASEKAAVLPDPAKLPA
jgi:perosamine synthetase